ncbi:trimeric LpxA-like protein [Pelagophyceae sp. CCMP2097]|nr:trimeric LpxA-like protein [Pelagophyceae sp. CCMP2097]
MASFPSAAVVGVLAAHRCGAWSLEAYEAAASALCDDGATDDGAADGVADAAADGESAWIFARSNSISRRATVSGAHNVSMTGSSVVGRGAVIRGDLALVRIGRYCEIGVGAVLRPPYRVDAATTTLSYLPLSVGSHATIGRGTVVEAAWIGVGVQLGPDCVVGKSCVLKDYCVVAAGAVVPDDVVVAPFAIVAGVPAAVIGSLSPGAVALRKRQAETRIAHLIADIHKRR